MLCRRPRSVRRLALVPPRHRTHARTLFNQVLQTTNRNGSQYRPAAADEKAPALGGYASIEKPGTVAADTVRYVTEEGDHVLVSKSITPTLYQQVVEDQPKVAGSRPVWRRAMRQRPQMPPRLRR